MERLLQVLDDVEDLVFTMPMLWPMLRLPLLTGLSATLAILLL